jgi:hypothetical protein
MLYEHISRKAALSEVLKCSLVAEQPVRIKLDGRGKGAKFVVAPNWRVITDRDAGAMETRYGRHGTCVQHACRVAKRQLLDLLNKCNRVAAGLASEAHKTRGSDVHDQVGSTAVSMEWTPADERSAGTAKLNTVALDDVGNRMLLTDSLSIDAFSG